MSKSTTATTKTTKQKTATKTKAAKRAKRTPEARPEPLDWDSVDRLAVALAYDLLDTPEAVATLMVLVNEIEKHPFDFSHVETVAGRISHHLFACTSASGEAYRRYVEKERARLLNLIEKGGASDA